jgi:hypothetical protein
MRTLRMLCSCIGCCTVAVLIVYAAVKLTMFEEHKHKFALSEVSPPPPCPWSMLAQSVPQTVLVRQPGTVPANLCCIRQAERGADAIFNTFIF